MDLVRQYLAFTDLSLAHQLLVIDKWVREFFQKRVLNFIV